MRHSATTLAATLVALAVAAPLAAQQAQLQGRVTDAQGQPLPGVGVTVQRVGAGAFTDAAGRYALALEPGTYEVEARIIGYRPERRTLTLAAGATASLDFTLEVSAIQLTEIVASVEAGQVTRREMGVDIASIDVADRLDRAVVTNVSELLNGRAGNVTIAQASGNVGAGSRIRIRGINSLTQSNNPLIIIDGVRASNDTEVGINRGQTFSRFDDLDPSDIERIQVVKGPAATALYGSEAAPGVIIVETRTGSAARDGMEVTANFESGMLSKATTFPDNYADVTPFVSGADDPRLDGWPVEQHPLTGQVFVRDNPFEDTGTSPFRTGRLTSTGVQVSGRGDEVAYFTSIGYDDQTGLFPSNDLRRINFRGNFRATPTDELAITVSSGYVTSRTNLPKSGNNTSGFFRNAVGGIPLASKNAEGECLATLLGGSDPSFCDKDGNIRAAFDKITPIISRENLERFTGSVRLNYTPFGWLTGSAAVGADVVDQQFTDAIPYDPDIPFSFAAGGENFQTRNLRRNVTVDLSSTASYPLSDALRASTGIGAQYFQDRNETIACEGRVFVNDRATACDAGVSLRGFSGLEEKTEIGAFVQQRFGFRDYLFVTGALRVDDNSALGANEPAIWSPSLNTSLVVSDLPAWNVDPALVSDLRLRFAWGTASQSPRQYAADRTYGVVRLARDGAVVPGLSPLSPGNADLGPERSSEVEVGFDAGLREGRIGAQFTFFNRATHDAIVQRAIAPSSGFANPQFVNLGELRNRGFEASINAVLVDREDVVWDAQLTWSGSRSEVSDLGLDNPVFFGAQVLQQGFAPGAYVSRVITSAERDANGDIVPASLEYAPGDLGDGSELRVVGQPHPTNEESLLTTLRLFRNLNVSALFERAAGHQLYSGLEDSREPGVVGGVNSRFGALWAYRQIRSTPVEQAMMEQDRLLGNHDGVWVHDADFIKWRELKVAYTLPAAYAGRFGMSDAVIYLGGRNLWTWTDYPGLDPEVNERGARDELTVNENNALPPPRMFFSGIRVTF